VGGCPCFPAVAVNEAEASAGGNEEGVGVVIHGVTRTLGVVPIPANWATR